jgi:DNA-binding IclR family transcriptional regulator
LLVTLVEEGWADQDPQSTQYQLGNDILGTAAVALAYSPLIQAAKATLSDISELSGLNSYLGVRVGHRVAYLATARGRDGHDSKFRVGVVEQAHAIADGRVLLAYLDDEELMAIYVDRTQLRSFTAKTITTVEALREDLRQVRAKGYALDIGERTEGWSYVAVPVRGRRGRVVGAMVAGGQDAVAPPDKLEWLAHEMRIAAEQLSVRLGFAEE